MTTCKSRVVEGRKASIGRKFRKIRTREEKFNPISSTHPSVANAQLYLAAGLINYAIFLFSPTRWQNARKWEMCECEI